MKTDPSIHEGDLTAKPGAVYHYTEIAGHLDARGADTKTAFPRLTSVGGHLDARGADTKTAFPRLTSVGGPLYASGADTKTAFPRLTSVGGYLDARGADTKTAFPRLTSVGGSLYARGADTKTAFPLAKFNDPANDAESKCRSMLLASFSAAGFSFADGILARLVSQRGPVSRVIICGNTDASYLVTNGDAFSHGKTLAEARDGLLYKIGSRDTSEFKTWALDREVSKRDAIRAYRTITGACEGGVRSWMEQRKTPEKITVKGIIEITDGAYGSKQFMDFFSAGQAQEGK